MEIKADKEIEVTEKQYKLLTTIAKGIIAHRQADNGKYYIKVWDMSCADAIKDILEKTK